MVITIAQSESDMLVITPFTKFLLAGIKAHKHPILDLENGQNT